MFRDDRRFAFAASAAVFLSLLYVVSAVFVNGKNVDLIALTFAEAESDHRIVERLAAAGLVDIASESTQWILLDNFGEAERVPLDAYRSRVEPFDPRDNGYADRLRAFFVNNGSRYLFAKVPAYASMPIGGSIFFKRLTNSLSGLEYRMESLGASRLPIAAIFAGAISLGLVGVLTGKFRRAVWAMPVILPTSLFGGSGVAVAGFLFIFFISLSDFLYSAVSGDGLKSAKRWFADRALVSVLTFAVALFVSLVAAIPFPLIIIGFAATSALSFLEAELTRRNAKSRGRRPFVPVPLSLTIFPRLVFITRLLLPFALCSFLVSTVGFFSNRGASEDILKERFPHLPSMTDYKEHLLLQRSFLPSRLYASGALDEYLTYGFDEQGLLAAGKPEDELAAYHEALPPAESLLFNAFVDQPRFSWGGLIAVLAIVFAAGTSLVSPRAKRRSNGTWAMLNEKRIAA